MPEDFETPPIGGENIPFKELEEERPPTPPQPETVQKPVEQQKKEIKKLKIKMIGAVMIMFIVIIVLVVLLLQPKPEPPPPSPSPSPSPSPIAIPSAVGRNVIERIEALEKQVESLDLSETDLALPILDFEINFDKRR